MCLAPIISGWMHDDACQWSRSELWTKKTPRLHWTAGASQPCCTLQTRVNALSSRFSRPANSINSNLTKQAVLSCPACPALLKSVTLHSTWEMASRIWVKPQHLYLPQLPPAVHDNQQMLTISVIIIERFLRMFHSNWPAGLSHSLM